MRLERCVVAAPIVAVATIVAGVAGTQHVGVRFRDPDNVAAGYVAMVGAAVILLVGLDIYLRARKREGGATRENLRAVREERWTWRRGVGVAVGLLSFYAAYLAYRNLKAIVPLLEPHRIVDDGLAKADRALFFGNDPAKLLHGIPGTAVWTQIFSTFYVAFIVFLPLSLAIALVFAPSLEASLLLTTAFSLNWLIGAASYFALPSLGPVYADPHLFATLPHSEVTHLQQVLLDQRTAYLAHPGHGTPQAIAAFASLHIAMSFTALLVARQLDAPQRLKQFLWIWLVITFVATVFLGWHYVLDDVAGLAIGAIALILARVMTGVSPRRARLGQQAKTAVAA
ncbi:MAG: hypothetical protein QOF76_1332 [Solirubrobacteraceae bacterium]|nr:hypothetical protein [Solirubrobacteraceae bacterium]